MASAPSDQPTIFARLDSGGRLVEADAPLESLQREAGSAIGQWLALPQIAAIAALARKLNVVVDRPAIAAGRDFDVHMRVCAIPDGDDIRLEIHGWTQLPSAPPRLSGHASDPNGAALEPAADEYATDGELRMIRLSAGLAEKLGISVEEAIGAPLTSLFKLEEDKAGALPLLNAVASRTGFDGQPVRGRLSGSSLFFLSGKAILGADGGFAGFSGSANWGEKQDGRQDQAPIIDVLDDALQDPLARIIDAADRIAMQSEGPLRSDYADYAADIAGAARHLMSVIHPSDDSSSQNDGRVDLALLAADAVGMLESTADERDVDLSMMPSHSLPATGEQRGITQILLNLIGNAIRHSPTGTHVSVSLGSEGDMACVYVSDEGPGIDPADQQRIFERFERGASTEPGTGLGLAISRRLARSMGGDVRLVSVPGEGATFSLLLPAA